MKMFTARYELGL